jgi:hypothetical protein
MTNEETKPRSISLTWIRLFEPTWDPTFSVCLYSVVHWMVVSIVSISEVHMVVKLELLITKLKITKIGRSPMAWSSFMASHECRYMKLVNIFQETEVETNWSQMWYGKLWVFYFNVFSFHKVVSSGHVHTIFHLCYFFFIVSWLIPKHCIFHTSPSIAFQLMCVMSVSSLHSYCNVLALRDI